ncbi:MAG: diguanylate cyclase, partial [Clostridia bacterium]|nr:diguanylate cyclase [Clostridia bacterium]
MKTRSIQFKFLITVISAILVITLFVGGLSIFEVHNYLEQHTKEVVELSCSNEAAQVNDTLGDIENSVRIMESYVLSLFKSPTAITNRDYQNAILQMSGEMFVDIAANTDGAVSYYLRFDPSISDGKTGIFFSKLNGGNEYVELEPTDLTLYAKDDTEHVGWFWLPYEAGEPIWLTPYHNDNNDILMISFVIPLYLDDQFVGIVGMDFDYTVLTERIHKIKIFDHGFAHLELNDVIIHTGHELSGEAHTDDDDTYFKASEKLANGMTLVMFASYDDIAQIRYDIEAKIGLAVVLLAVAFSLVVFWIVKKIVSPLRALTDAAVKLSGGDYDVTIEHSDTYEIRQLSTAFDNMLVKLREHKKIQHLLTYRDSLTGLRNTTSYKAWVVDFDKKIQAEPFPFGVMVLDINYLKETNDTYGHNVGNKLIAGAAQIISDGFKRSP